MSLCACGWTLIVHLLKLSAYMNYFLNHRTLIIFKFSWIVSSWLKVFSCLGFFVIYTTYIFLLLHLTHTLGSWDKFFKSPIQQLMMQIKSWLHDFCTTFPAAWPQIIPCNSMNLHMNYCILHEILKTLFPGGDQSPNIHIFSSNDYDLSYKMINIYY